MAAFDVTTKPTSLTLKAGTTGSIMVVVSNRLGRPVMGLIEGTVTPASAARWLTSPPPGEAQRRYEADPAATASFEYKIAVPADAAAQDVQFKATVRDALAPDDTKVEGQTVGIKVTRDAPPPPPNGKKIPWWVWVVAGVVLLGAGIGIFLALRPKGVPDVVGKTVEEAKSALTKAGFDTVVVKDTLGDQAKDTNRVVRQEPVPGKEAKAAENGDKTAEHEDSGKAPSKVATIVVNRVAVTVPPVAGQPASVGIERLKQAGLVLGNTPGQRTTNLRDNQTVARADPPEGTRVKSNDTIDLIIWAWDTTTRRCPPGALCPVVLDPAFKRQIETWRTQPAPQIR